MSFLCFFKVLFLQAHRLPSHTETVHAFSIHHQCSTYYASFIALLSMFKQKHQGKKPGAEIKPSGAEVSRAALRLLTRGEPPPAPITSCKEITMLFALRKVFPFGSKEGCSVTRSLYFLFPHPSPFLSYSFFNLGMHLPLTINKEEWIKSSSIKILSFITPW